MIIDEEPLVPRTPLLATPPLDRLGIAELRDYIAGLEREIVRTRTEIARKEKIRAAADSVFRTPE